MRKLTGFLIVTSIIGLSGASILVPAIAAADSSTASASSPADQGLIALLTQLIQTLEAELATLSAGSTATVGGSHDATVSCPTYPTPVCSTGTQLSQGVGANGCALAPQCIAISSNSNAAVPAVAPATGTAATDGTFSVKPSSGKSPLGVVFSGTVPSASSMYYTNFGDGFSSSPVSPVAQMCSSSASGASSCWWYDVSHTYTVAGTYTASLIESATGQSIDSVTVTVTAPAPCVAISNAGCQ